MKVRFLSLKHLKYSKNYKTIFKIGEYSKQFGEKCYYNLMLQSDTTTITCKKYGKNCIR